MSEQRCRVHQVGEEISERHTEVQAAVRKTNALADGDQRKMRLGAIVIKIRKSPAERYDAFRRGLVLARGSELALQRYACLQAVASPHYISASEDLKWQLNTNGTTIRTSANLDF